MVYKFLISFLRFLAGWRKTGDLRSGRIGRVLVVELTRLGDVVTMLPTIRALQRSYPAASLHVVVDARYSSLITSIVPGVEVVAAGNSADAAGFYRLLMNVRKVRPDLACSMSPSRRNAALVLASSARYKVGYLTDSDTVTPYLETLPVEAFGFDGSSAVRFGKENISSRPLKVLRVLAVEPSTQEARVPIGDESVDLALARLRIAGMLPDRRYIAVHPFSEWRYRTWDQANFITLGEAVVRRLGHDVVYICGPEDTLDVDRMKRMSGTTRGLYFCTAGDFVDTLAVLSGCTLFVGNDSGPLHLAAYLGIPSVGLFGPAPPELTGSPARSALYLYKRLECSPCNQKECVRPDDPCLAKITTDEVFAAVTRLLASDSEGGAVAHA